MNPTNSDALPDRSHPAHPAPVQLHNTPTILHVTVCLSPRLDALANDQTHDALKTAWRQADAWLVVFYLIMPDHIHMFCAPGKMDRPPVKQWATYWKRLASQINPDLQGTWQADCWDTQMRSSEHYVEKLEYVNLNPVRKGLVNVAEEWSFRGRIFELPWL